MVGMSVAQDHNLQYLTGPYVYKQYLFSYAGFMFAWRRDVGCVK